MLILIVERNLVCPSRGWLCSKAPVCATYANHGQAHCEEIVAVTFLIAKLVIVHVITPDDVEYLFLSFFFLIVEILKY